VFFSILYFQACAGKTSLLLKDQARQGPLPGPGGLVASEGMSSVI
jgi:hypothetical protein